MKKVISLLLSIFILAPSFLWAAGGGGATDIVVVADTRVLGDGIMKYFATTYNEDMWMFAAWAAILTACYGAFLGVIMDYLMSKTGLDLKSRKIVEH
ncbi:MAG: hypothetical protein HQK79_19100 [Desulfobacterales bacterium]|nr:hypothetical protein [Desulfobacterales bacterium]MBF0397026.1 hypothetical protein [Desulfobacterales bacterium]